MTDGMKPGRGDDPFADDDGENATEESADRDLPLSDEPDRTGVERRDEPALPYIYRRETTKSGREQKPIFLQPDTLDREAEFQETVSKHLDEDVSVLDLREAAYLVAMTHSEEVADQLREWGYDYR